MTTQTVPTAPRTHFLLGNLPEFQRDTLAFIDQIKPYGDLVRFHFGPYPVYYTQHPDLIHQILVTDSAKFQKAQTTRRVLYPVVGEGLFTSNGEFWKRQRKLAQPAFHSKRIGAYADVMVQLTEQMLATWADGQQREISGEMAGVTMNIITQTLFDASVGPEIEAVKAAILTALHEVDHRFNQLIPIPDWLPTASNRRLSRAMAITDRIIQRFVDARRASGEDKGDLLSMLLAAQDEDGGGMNDKQLRDECMTLFGAGHETTAVTLTWALYLLSQHPEAESRLYAEVDAVLGGRPATLEDLNHMPYTDWVIRETLRFYPPAWATTRENTVDVELGGYHLPKGSIVFLGFLWMHHDVRGFDAPDAFDPERFSPAREKEIDRRAYLPFGAGPRVCIGNMFAMMEARLILATIAQRYRLSLAPGHTVRPERLFTLRPKDGMPMILHARQPQPSAASPEAHTA